MNLNTMRTRVRRELMDEGTPSRFSDDQLDRAIARAVNELSRYSPLPRQTTLATVENSAQIDITSLGDRISVDRVEFPMNMVPRRFVRFEVYGDTLYLLEIKGNGSDCRIYWSDRHVLDTGSSTIPAHLDDVVSLGASAYAVLSLSQLKTDTANYGGTEVDNEYSLWGRGRLAEFSRELKKLKSKVRTGLLYPQVE